jgi:hypothetical protein
MLVDNCANRTSPEVAWQAAEGWIEGWCQNPIRHLAVLVTPIQSDRPTLGSVITWVDNDRVILGQFEAIMMIFISLDPHDLQC